MRKFIIVFMVLVTIGLLFANFLITQHTQAQNIGCGPTQERAIRSFWRSIFGGNRYDGEVEKNGDFCSIWYTNARIDVFVGDDEASLAPLGQSFVNKLGYSSPEYPTGKFYTFWVNNGGMSVLGDYLTGRFEVNVNYERKQVQIFQNVCMYSEPYTSSPVRLCPLSWRWYSTYVQQVVDDSSEQPTATSRAVITSPSSPTPHPTRPKVVPNPTDTPLKPPVFIWQPTATQSGSGGGGGGSTSPTITPTLTVSIEALPLTELETLATPQYPQSTMPALHPFPTSASSGRADGAWNDGRDTTSSGRKSSGGSNSSQKPTSTPVPESEPEPEPEPEEKTSEVPAEDEQEEEEIKPTSARPTPKDPRPVPKDPPREPKDPPREEP